jgi:hypothetical protein
LTSTEIAEQFRAFLRHLQPHDVPGMQKFRMGAERDGGYVMLDDFGPARNALSLGIGADVSWDSAIAGRGFHVYQFDPTVARSPEANPHFVFHQTRVVGRPEAHGDVTLSAILARPELASDQEVIAKIDTTRRNGTCSRAPTGRACCGFASWRSSSERYADSSSPNGAPP